MKNTPPPVIIKSSRLKGTATALLSLCMSAVGVWKMMSDKTPIPEKLLLGFAAIFLTGFALYLLAIVIFGPIALRMDKDGISGYFAPPLRWKDISDIDVYVMETRRSYIPITYAGFKITHSAVLFKTVSFRRYEQALRNRRRSGYHVLVPQLMLKDMDAASVVAYARAFQAAAMDRAKAACSAPPTMM